MSLSLHDVPAAAEVKACILNAELVGFPTLRDADEYAAQVRGHFEGAHDYDLYTFAAGEYLVIFVPHNQQGATDGTEHNS